MAINNPSLPANPSPALPEYRARDVAGQDMVSTIVGFDVQNQRPIDGRSIVDTIVQRNNLRYAFFGLKVYVTTLDKEYRFINTNYRTSAGFVSFIDADWKDLSITDGSRTFIGIYEPATNGQFIAFAPPLPLGAAYFTVKTVNNALVPMLLNSGDALTQIKSNGQIIWNLPTSKWIYIPPLEPTQITQFPHTDITDWDQQIRIDIANNAIVPYVPTQTYPSGQVVRVVTIDGAIESVDLYQALRNIVASDNISNPGAFKLLTTLDYRKLKYRLLIDNLRGLGANVQTPTVIGGDDVTLSANEIDRRIGNNASGGRFPINGGNAYTPDSVLGPKIIP